MTLDDNVPADGFYVYVLARSDGTPFYVGKGHGRRIYEHENDARRGIRSHKCNIIRKIWKSGGEVQRYIVFTTDDEQEAHSYEMELIALYGRENLSNRTNGGEGASGMVVSDATREKLAEITAARWADPVVRDDLITKMKAHFKSHPDLVAPHVAAMHTPEARHKARTNYRAFLATPKAKALRSATTRALWQQESYREKLTAARRAFVANPEALAKRGAAIKAAYADPEVREKSIARLRSYSTDPEIRARRAATLRATIARRNADKPKICMVEGCERVIRAKGLCKQHYKREAYRVAAARRKAAKDKES